MNVYLPLDSEIPLLGVCLPTRRDCARTISAFFTIYRNWKHPTCTAGERVNYLLQEPNAYDFSHICPVKWLSAARRVDGLVHVTTCMKLADVMRNERNLKLKISHCVVLFIGAAGGGGGGRSWSEQQWEDWLGRDGRTSWRERNTLYGVRGPDYRGASLAKSVLFIFVYLNGHIFYL